MAWRDGSRLSLRSGGMTPEGEPACNEAGNSRMTVLERTDTAELPQPFAHWFASRGWEPRAHQLELLAKARAGRSVLLIAPTGAGKTLAGFLPSLVELNAS